MCEIVFDCERAAPLARFWAAVLDDYDIRPYDDDEIARLASLGYTPETDPTVILDGDGPSICFQEVNRSDNVKGRLHLDVESSDRRADVVRIVDLDGSAAANYDDHTVMTDPEGNEFCLYDQRS